jgi:hypothetical protein
MISFLTKQGLIKNEYKLLVIKMNIINEINCIANLYTKEQALFKFFNAKTCEDLEEARIELNLKEHVEAIIDYLFNGKKQPKDIFSIKILLHLYYNSMIINKKFVICDIINNCDVEYLLKNKILILNHPLKIIREELYLLMMTKPYLDYVEDKEFMISLYSKRKTTLLLLLRNNFINDYVINKFIINNNVFAIRYLKENGYKFNINLPEEIIFNFIKDGNVVMIKCLKEIGYNFSKAVIDLNDTIVLHDYNRWQNKTIQRILTNRVYITKKNLLIRGLLPLTAILIYAIITNLF